MYIYRESRVGLVVSYYFTLSFITYKSKFSRMNGEKDENFVTIHLTGVLHGRYLDMRIFVYLRDFTDFT